MLQVQRLARKAQHMEYTRASKCCSTTTADMNAILRLQPTPLLLHITHLKWRVHFTGILSMLCQPSPTESQNHRMVGVGRASGPTPLPKEVHLQQAAQDLLQVSLEYLQRRRLHNLSGQPVPVLCHPQREEVLPLVQMELQFVPIAPCPVAGHH